MESQQVLKKLVLSADIASVLENKILIVPQTRKEMIDLAFGPDNSDEFEVAYDVEGKGRVVEATVTKCKNGAAVNYNDIYMRRRDPDCLVVADELDTDKPKYFERYGEDFNPARQDTLNWLKKQNKLIVMPFMAGGNEYGFPALLVAPDNAGFFAAGLADLQGYIPRESIPDNYKPLAIIFVAPPFRHTHFKGRQVVVHNRTNDVHELFSFNLYPGPSAKKGVYGFLIHIGESQGWLTLHGSSVKLVTPYDNEFVIMHEGASGSGKSEMLEEIHRMHDGRVMLAKNTVNQEQIIIEMPDTCDLYPVTDDMALCHNVLQEGKKRLVITDAEQGWFIRLDHIKGYNTDPMIEKISIHPPDPLIFFNIEGHKGATCLIWEHTMDKPGVPCPNPRIIIPRRFIHNIVNQPMEVDVRSFGVRTPPTTKTNPNYGILGFLHILPPALAWLWRLAAPRGHSNPSIVGADGLSSEGVGSYWPFATGKMVTQANLLLEQIKNTPNTRYMLIPNQYVGAYKVGFMPEWISREYFARRGSFKFKPEHVIEARCPLLGLIPENVKISGTTIPHYLLQVDLQPEVDKSGYDEGAKMLNEFFKKELSQFLVPELSDLGRSIIETCLNDGTVEDFNKLLPYL